MQFTITESQQKIVDIIIEKYKDSKFKEAHEDTDLSEENTRLNDTNGLSKTDITLLEKLFKEHLINERIHQAMALVEIAPWHIHADYNKGDKNPGKAILIPWQTCDSHTLVFNEICTESLDSKSDIVNFPKVDNHVSRELYEKYMSHCQWEDAQKVSIKEIFAWERGRAVTWDRTLLHTSDNFIKNGVDIKIALVIFTERV
jgi:hypothetical protein